jgi:hypothetical protein
MEATLSKLEANDPGTLKLLDGNDNNGLSHLAAEERRQHAIAALKSSIQFAKSESVPEGHQYHSRDPLVGLIQSALEDNLPPEAQAFGQGNPIVWIPAGVLGILEHRVLSPRLFSFLISGRGQRQGDAKGLNDGERFADLTGLFAFLNVDDESQSRSGSQSEFSLRDPNCLPSLPDKLSDLSSAVFHSWPLSVPVRE